MSRMVTGRPSMARNRPMKSSRSSGSSFSRASVLSAGIIFGTIGSRVDEHVLGSGEADPRRAVAARETGILKSVGIGKHADLTNLIGPGRQPTEVTNEPNEVTGVPGERSG